MDLLKFLTVLLMASCVFANGLVKRKCSNIDEGGFNCSMLIVQDLLRDYSGGIPDLGIKPLDRIYLDQIEVAEDALGFKSVFPSLRVTGFKNVAMEHTREKDNTDTLRYSLKFDFVAEGFISVEFPEKKKAFTGDITYSGGASAAVTHIFSSKTVHHGSQVRTVTEPGPEQIVCESLHATSKLDNDLASALQSDADVQAVQEQWVKIEKEHQAKVVCAIAEAVFKVAINNIRAFARVGLVK